jgi:hypothetical protein
VLRERRLGVLEPTAVQKSVDAHRYESAAELTLVPCTTDVNGLAACELRTAALRFEISAALGKEANKEKAWKQCVVCPVLLSAFKGARARGQTLARATLRDHPDDDETLFFSRQAGPELRLAAVGDARTQDWLG